MKKKHIAVVGGGITGCVTALLAAKKGLDVSLYEISDSLGGVLKDLKAKDDARKEKEGEERLNLERMRAMMNDQNQDEKREQNEELAKLRADTSIQKTILSKTIPSSDKIPDQVSIIRKGE